MPSIKIDSRLPIICISIDNLHYNFIVALMSDLFGIQTRGGVSCTGLFAEHIKNKYNIDGWCRITFNWLMTINEINFILDAINFICKKGNRYLKYYHHNIDTNLFEYISQKLK